MTDAELLQRFIVAAAGLEPDLAEWLSAAVWSGLAPSRRRRIRDDLLREAVRLLPADSAWQKAHALVALAGRARAPDASTPAGLVALAWRVYPHHLSASQVFRIVSRRSPMVMRVTAVHESEADDQPGGSR